jgi:hypothetical protein
VTMTTKQAYPYLITHGSRWRPEPTIHKLVQGLGSTSCAPTQPTPYGEPLKELPDEAAIAHVHLCKKCFTVNEIEGLLTP